MKNETVTLGAKPGGGVDELLSSVGELVRRGEHGEALMMLREGYGHLQVLS